MLFKFCLLWINQTNDKASKFNICKISIILFKMFLVPKNNISQVIYLHQNNYSRFHRGKVACVLNRYRSIVLYQTINEKKKYLDIKKVLFVLAKIQTSTQHYIKVVVQETCLICCCRCYPSIRSTSGITTTACRSSTSFCIWSPLDHNLKHP